VVRCLDQIGAIAVDQSSKVSGVVARVRGMVHDGTLREGDPLPSTRALAAELGVARGTVVAAYEQLDGEGYLRTRHGALARVAADLRGRTTSAPSPVGTDTTGSGAAGVAAAPPTAPLIDCRPGIPAVTAIPQRDGGQPGAQRRRHRSGTRSRSPSAPRTCAHRSSPSSA
jgi:DNA-binding transcriptional MocR family regulator